MIHPETKTQPIPIPNQLLSAIARTDSYAASMAEHLVSDASRDELRAARAAALSSGVNELIGAKLEQDAYLTPTEHLYNTMGQLYGFIEARQHIDAARRDGTYLRKNHQEDILTLISFNNALRGAIDRHPRVSPDQLHAFLSLTYATAFGNTGLAYTEQALGERVTGMQTEVGFEQIIGTLEGLEYRHATPQEELATSADFFVQLPGKEEIPIDVKSGARSALGRRDMLRPDKAYPLYPGTRQEDFKGTFRLPTDTATEKSLGVLDKIHAAYTYYASERSEQRIA